MGYAAGRYVLKDAQGRDGTVAFFPGPEGSGWAPDTYEGFRQAPQDNADNVTKGAVTILPPEYGDTGDKMQRKLIKHILTKHEGVDYIVGNAVAVAAAVEVVNTFRTRHPDVKIVGTYIIPSVYESIQQGAIAAAPSDLTVAQGRMAVDMMVRILNGEKPGDHAAKFPFRAGPLIPMITRETIDDYSYEYLFGPKNFQPIFNYQP